MDSVLLLIMIVPSTIILFYNVNSAKLASNSILMDFVLIILLIHSVYQLILSREDAWTVSHLSHTTKPLFNVRITSVLDSTLMSLKEEECVFLVCQDSPWPLNLHTASLFIAWDTTWHQETAGLAKEDLHSIITSVLLTIAKLIAIFNLPLQSVRFAMMAINSIKILSVFPKIVLLSS